jgi:hypothetical protein
MDIADFRTTPPLSSNIWVRGCPSVRPNIRTTSHSTGNSGSSKANSLVDLKQSWGFRSRWRSSYGGRRSPQPARDLFSDRQAHAPPQSEALAKLVDDGSDPERVTLCFKQVRIGGIDGRE